MRTQEPRSGDACAEGCGTRTQTLGLRHGGMTRARSCPRGTPQPTKSTCRRACTKYSTHHGGVAVRGDGNVAPPRDSADFHSLQRLGLLLSLASHFSQVRSLHGTTHSSSACHDATFVRRLCRSHRTHGDGGCPPPGKPAQQPLQAVQQHRSCGVPWPREILGCIAATCCLCAVCVGGGETGEVLTRVQRHTAWWHAPACRQDSSAPQPLPAPQAHAPSKPASSPRCGGPLNVQPPPPSAPRHSTNRSRRRAPPSTRRGTRYHPARPAVRTTQHKHAPRPLLQHFPLPPQPHIAAPSTQANTRPLHCG
jgi:hypothetical protein